MQREDMSENNALSKNNQRKKATQRFSRRNTKAVQQMPENSLTRFMFYELVVRIACEKF